ncbi:MAG TPA: Gfo/Idh/MocA family oxidoreductase [Candidatus Nanoarchaeia archaeon]|nr:Gfo/Idh/MocA family oxidoreductase [Candidatus Nanoarchaeia archaeon]
MGMSLDWLIVGTGMMGKIVAPIARQAGGNIVGVVGSREERVSAYLDAVNLPASTPIWTFDTYSNALADSGANAVAVLSPNFMHKDMGVAAARAGKHILMEKPLATSLTDAQAFFDAAITAGIAAEVNSQYRHHEVFNEVARLIASGEFGRPTYIRGQYLQDWQMNATDGIGWRPEIPVAGRGKLVGDLGPHVLQTTLHLFGGEFVELTGTTFNVHPVRYKFKGGVESFGGKGVPSLSERPDLYESMDMLDGSKYSGDDIARATFMLRTAAGAYVPGDYLLSQVHPGHKNKFTFELNFEKGKVYWDQEDPNHLVIAGPDGQERIYQRGSAPGIHGRPPGHPQGIGDSNLIEIERMQEVIASNNPGRIRLYTERNVGQAVQAMKMIEQWLSAPLIPLQNYQPAAK